MVFIDSPCNPNNILVGRDTAPAIRGRLLKGNYDGGFVVWCTTATVIATTSQSGAFSSLDKTYDVPFVVAAK